MEADSTAGQSSAAKKIAEHHAQEYGRQFDKLLREKAPRVLSIVDSPSVDGSKLWSICLTLFQCNFGPPSVPLGYWQHRHGLSAADVEGLTDREAVELIVADAKAVIRSRGRT